ncbi:hypothetical protein [Nocardia sp. NPDC060259]|uniref:hypothetical protein n=1 Tax=Nocardia sp. NPDC060259 TaxID=3347088 RepID=UPI00365AD5A4
MLKSHRLVVVGQHRRQLVELEDDVGDGDFVADTDLQRTRQGVEGFADLLAVAIEDRVEHPAQERAESFLARFGLEGAEDWSMVLFIVSSTATADCQASEAEYARLRPDC